MAYLSFRRSFCGIEDGSWLNISTNSFERFLEIELIKTKRGHWYNTGYGLTNHIDDITTDTPQDRKAAVDIKKITC